MSKLPDNKDENYEELKEQLEEETGTEVPAENGVPLKISMYAAAGVLLLVVILLVIAKLRKKSTKEVQSVTAERKDEREVTFEEMPEMKLASVHEQGSREDQQDSFGVSDLKDQELVRKKGILFTVADGMGGLMNGGQISSLVVTTCQNMFHNLPEQISAPNMLLEMAAQVNFKVNQFLVGRQRGGSTLVSVIIRDKVLHFLTIGDSRIYLFRNGVLFQLNREHIYREELALMAVNGKMSAGRIEANPQVKSLTSYLGNGYIAHLDRNTDGIRLIDKDKIILASDGVFGTLSVEQMEEVLAFSVEEASAKIKEMVEEAKKPYQDNYTAVIYEYRE